ncbi:MAG: DUF2510 domain-containing protein [Candidatus Leucobacter sulfamidivorax]|nr:DUF2510 domain-containing protein [Candidatus Leucobacter sulfamidivorax]
MNTFSPGWYPDPYDSQVQRYWDGERWTEHTHPLAGTAQAPEPQGQTATQAPFPSEPPAPKRSRAWLWWVIGVAGVLLVAAAVACVWWALAVVGQASAEDRDPCDSSLAQCDGPGRDEPEPEPETRPTPTTTRGSRRPRRSCSGSARPARWRPTSICSRRRSPRSAARGRSTTSESSSTCSSRSWRRCPRRRPRRRATRRTKRRSASS